MDTQPNPPRKRHHYVPVTYLRGWAGGDENVYAYPADAPGKCLRVKPEEIGFERYYYSIELEDGSRDHDSFEELFGGVESRWPGVLAAIEAGTIGPQDAHWLYSMMTIMRTRGPAARTFNESVVAVEMRTGIKVFAELGKLPEKLSRYEDQLDTVPIAVNPQQTLAKMSEDMKRFGDLMRPLGFEVLVNETESPFITSDNPVAYYDAADPGIRIPYYESRFLELYFPLSSRHVLHGSPKLLRHGPLPRFRVLREPGRVRAINRTTARFAYRFAFARDDSASDLIRLHSCTSPVAQVRVVRRQKEIQYHLAHRFTERPKLNKFRPEMCEGHLYDEDFGVSQAVPPDRDTME